MGNGCKEGKIGRAAYLCDRNAALFLVFGGLLVEKGSFNKILKVFQFFSALRKLRKMSIDVILY